MAVSSLHGQNTPDPPDPPKIDLVSVDSATGNVLIKWIPSSSPAVDRYIIHLGFNISDEFAGAVIDTVTADKNVYFHETTEASSQSLAYTVTSLDSINESPLPDFHKTIYTSLEYDSCNKEIHINWTPYVGWETIVMYEVYHSMDGSPFTLIGEVGHELTGIIHKGITENNNHCYLVKAIRNPPGSSFSNRACYFTRQARHPAYIIAESANVSGDKHIDLSFSTDPDSEVNDFELLQSAGPGKPFVHKDYFLDNRENPINVSVEVLSTQKRYLYQLASVDGCLKRHTLSNVTGNIVATADVSGLESFLSWNPYFEYEAGVKNYHIYQTTSQREGELIASLGNQDSSYTDNLSGLSGNEISEEICYYIVAEENDKLRPGEKGYSRSNTICISTVPDINMANAFTPNGDGRNEEIKPVLTFIPSNYLFTVFDRWGSMVFETTDPVKGWDGRVRDGDKAVEGVFIYYIKLTTLSGIRVEKRGQITLFYP